MSVRCTIFHFYFTFSLALRLCFILFYIFFRFYTFRGMVKERAVCLCSYLFVYWLVSCLAEGVLLHDHYEFSHLFDGEYFNGACACFNVCVSTVHVHLISFCCCDNIFAIQHFSLAFVLSLDFNLVYRCFFNPILPAMATSHSIHFTCIIKSLSIE